MGAYEVWKEADLIGIPFGYMGILTRETARMIDSAIFSTTTIITGGVAGNDWKSYLRLLLLSIGPLDLHRIDGVGLHPYLKAVGGFPELEGWSEMEDAVLEAHVSSGFKPVWLTEFGVSMLPGTPNLQRQATFLDRAYELFADLGPGIVPHAFWFAWHDGTLSAPPYEQLFGLVDSGTSALRCSGRSFLAHVRGVIGNPNCGLGPVDLRPTEIQFDPAEIVPGWTAAFESGIQNLGTAASSSFNIRWLVDGVDVGAYGNHVGVPAATNMMDGNSSFHWVVTPGVHTITFIVDVDDFVGESNEFNNQVSVTVGSGLAASESWFTVSEGGAPGSR